MRAEMIAAFAWLLLVAAPAEGATVGVAAGCYKEDCWLDAIYTAMPGEANRLTVERTSHTTLVFRDAGAPLTAGQDCAADGDAVVCAWPYPDWLALKVDAGDGDDVVTVPDGEVQGGAGDDVLTGDTVTGGSGRDVVRARFIVDADGSRPARDRYEGERVSYEGRRAGIRIDLRGGRAGEDVLVGVRDAIAGSGADVLIGTDGPNELQPGPGRDRVVALGGDDKLTGEGRDRIDAGAGDDELELGSRASGMRAQCGPGRDSVTNSHPSTRLTACERVALGFGSASLRERLPGTRAAVLTVKGCWCVKARWVIYAGRVTIGSARGRRDRVVLRLNARGRALLVRERRMSVRIELHERPTTEGFRTELRLR